MEGGYYVRVALRSMAKHIQPVPIAPIDEPAQAKQPDRRWARRAVPRDAAIVLALHMTFNEAVHVHDPVDTNEADRIFAYSVKGLADQMLLPILMSDQHVLQDGDLSFQHDVVPVAPGNDRHASKLIRKQIKKRKQSFATEKTSAYGNYAASRASSRTESRFGSRFGGSRVSTSVRKGHKMSLALGFNGGEFMNLESQASNNNSPWLSSSSVTSTARGAVDFAELQRRTDIERDLSTRDSVRRSNDEINRKNEVRIKLRSLADPTVSLEKEEAMIAALGERGQRSRLQQSRQGTRGKNPATLSPLNGKRGLNLTTLDTNENMTFRTEDYEGLTSDVVLYGKGGELLISENCFVVEHKLRQELLLDLHTRGVIQPRIKLVGTSKPAEENSPITTKKLRSPPRPLRSPSPLKHTVTNTTEFGDQIGSFESSSSLSFDFQGVPLAKGVALKLPDPPVAQSSHNRNAIPQKAGKKTAILENLPSAKLLTALTSDPTVIKASQSDSALQKTSRIQSSGTAKMTSAGSPVLPKHVHNGEKHLQNLRIRTPAYPNRLSHKTPLSIDGAENLFSLHEVSILLYINNCAC
ncbi:hypothetical protein PPTG_16968 [Phytophthora nicotianae INRA-310]|uniref:Uncharacterized protein n=1 Tax=Phytophthora nicotianae (strain INRA-310) TaxID=761204 RepID=W2PLM8_PHYN3|nr:hypothetical protein PPTG_16968 [Phytophthora nicotianae INRA-310]ETN01898.1 hypothetical protein PPTG_16968 [Phytophthora nicotianae INRA-310]